MSESKEVNEMKCAFIKRGGVVCGHKSAPDSQNCRFHVDKVGFKKCTGAPECDKLTISKSGTCTDCGLKLRKEAEKNGTKEKKVRKAVAEVIVQHVKDDHKREDEFDALTKERDSLTQRLEEISGKLKLLADFLSLKDSLYSPVSIIDQKF